VLALAKALEARDDHTAGHGQRMVELAERIALRLGCTPAELETIRWAALLHDIGKLGIPDRILLKQGPLTAEEWIIMRRHPQIGAEIVNRVSNLADVTELIQDHHERWDGQGYPRQKMGEEIPLGARIVAVVDVYSAMTDGRCYRSPCTHAEAVQELKRCSGTNFDPQVVEAFISLYR
jgi:putative nucleotidyltransferase with HDIG domain